MADCIQNPFPSTAVARLRFTAVDELTVPTKALATAMGYVDDYLRAEAHADLIGHGTVLAIVGDYGTGKTHLAMELLARLRYADNTRIHTFYLDAPADTFVALYRERFITRLRRNDVRERVQEYFAEVVARELDRSAITQSLAVELRADRIEPHVLVKDFALPEAHFQQLLQRKLHEVTQHDDFGTALALFLRPEFEDAVWEWLCGSPPDPVLVERGVGRTLDTEAHVLEALGVLAILYGQQGHRFVLIIDEMEKLLAGSRPAKRTVLALKKLMEIMGKAGALLILVGLPDFLDALPRDAKQRFSATVHVEGLSTKETTDYVATVLGTPTDLDNRSVRALAPFSAATLRYLNQVAGGNARKVVRLCHYSWQNAHDVGSDVTAAMVREVARTQFELATEADIDGAVGRVIDARGWRFERQANISDGANTTYDYWVPVGDTKVGCGMSVTRSVLLAEEVRVLQRHHPRQASLADGVLTLLIVNGNVADGLLDDLEKTFTRVLLYKDGQFEADLDAALGGLVQRLEETARESALDFLRERVDQISRQNQNLHAELMKRIPSASSIEGAVRRGVQGSDMPQAQGTSRLPQWARRATGLLRTVEGNLINIETILQRPILLSLDDEPDPRIIDGIADLRRTEEWMSALGYVTTVRLAFGVLLENVNKALRVRRGRRERHDAVSAACRNFDRFVSISHLSHPYADFPMRISHSSLFGDLVDVQLADMLRDLQMGLPELASSVYEAATQDLHEHE
jgi:type II secretory pathway predicted ATPase ExeA